MIARAATTDDADEIVRLAALMYATMHHDVTNPVWLQSARDAFTGRLGDDLAVFAVDDPHGDGLIACGAGTISTRLPAPNNLSARVGYIQWVATDESARGQGCGRAVMNALLEWYAAQDVPVVELHATVAGEPLYRDLGFSHEGPVALRRRG